MNKNENIKHLIHKMSRVPFFLNSVCPWARRYLTSARRFPSGKQFWLRIHSKLERLLPEVALFLEKRGSCLRSHGVRVRESDNDILPQLLMAAYHTRCLVIQLTQQHLTERVTAWLVGWFTLALGSLQGKSMVWRCHSVAPSLQTEISTYIDIVIKSEQLRVKVNYLSKKSLTATRKNK